MLEWNDKFKIMIDERLTESQTTTTTTAAASATEKQI